MNERTNTKNFIFYLEQFSRPKYTPLSSMPFEVGRAINQFTDSLVSNTAINTIFRNPIYTALLLAFLIVILVVIINFGDEPTPILALRAGFYIFVVLSVGIFLNNKLLMRDSTSVVDDSLVQKAFMENDFSGGIGRVNDVNIQPTYGSNGSVMNNTVSPVSGNYKLF